MRERIGKYVRSLDNASGCMFEKKVFARHVRMVAGLMQQRVWLRYTSMAEAVLEEGCGNQSTGCLPQRDAHERGG